MSIPFTQYLLPDGRKRYELVDRPQEIEDIANSFIANGGKFECEILTTGHVSFTACKFDRDVEIEICTNGPDVLEAIDRLVRRAGDGSQYKEIEE